ncbi:hypothetical protein [Pseudomonas ovata]|uniref:hypothetical protein n=1 Tax=Pseudomonas ovata TaxID=1839709 RepID=UPI000D691C86|nr:hypothetical protein [Pseudomonas ovata]
MATVKKTTVDDGEQSAAGEVSPAAPATVIYTDTLYTSRSLFLQNNRELKVLRGRVEVPADDAEALAYLAGHPELKLLAE